VDMHRTLKLNVRRCPRSCVPVSSHVCCLLLPSRTSYGDHQVGLELDFDLAIFAKRYLDEGGFGVLMLVASTLLDHRSVVHTLGDNPAQKRH